MARTAEVEPKRANSGADCLELMWHDFKRRYDAAHAPFKITKKMFSRLFLDASKDEDLFTRWTNSRRRANYRVPMHRVQGVGDLLEAPQDAIDELMIARLEEVGSRRDEGVRTIARWFENFGMRQVMPSSDAEDVLVAYLSARQKFPGKLEFPERHAELVSSFENLLAEVRREETAGKRVGPADTDAYRAELLARVQAGMVKNWPKIQETGNEHQAALRKTAKKRLDKTYDSSRDEVALEHKTFQRAFDALRRPR